jgi:hypothetical protein
MIVVEPSVVELAERCIAAVAPWTAGNAMYENQPVELASVAYDSVLEGTFLLGDQTSEVAQQQPWLQDSEQVVAQLEQPGVSWFAFSALSMILVLHIVHRSLVQLLLIMLHHLNYRFHLFALMI